MTINPKELAGILSIRPESAKLILDRLSDLSEQEFSDRLQEVGPLAIEQRNWIWEIHKQCDQLLHQRLASFTAAQAMTLAAFTLLTVARFNADPQKIDLTRINLLDRSRFIVIGFGVFLAVAGFL